jgi:phosphoglycerate dehydrogenase-like enzyme
MVPGSLLINTARGDVVDQTALAAALENGQLAGAAIDTFLPEPPDSDHPLLRLSPAASDRLLLTPHSAGVTTASYCKMLRGALENLATALRGESPKHVVNEPS